MNLEVKGNARELDEILRILEWIIEETRFTWREGLLLSDDSI